MPWRIFGANKITHATHKRATLIVGATIYELITDLLTPKKPNEAYQEIVDRLAKHFKPTKSSIIAHFQFNSVFQFNGVPVNQSPILGNVVNCGLNLNEMLRDRLVCGVQDERIQKSLPAQPEDKLDLKHTVELAQLMELAGQ